MFVSQATSGSSLLGRSSCRTDWELRLAGMCRLLVIVPILFLLALSPCEAVNAGIRLELLLMRLVCALLPMVPGAVCRRLAAWSGQTGAASGSCRHLAAPLMAGACTWGRAPVPALRSDARGAPAQVRAALRGRVPATPELRAPAAVCRWRAAHACRGAPTVSSGATVAPAPELAVCGLIIQYCQSFSTAVERWQSDHLTSILLGYCFVLQASAAASHTHMLPSHQQALLRF